MFGIFVIDATFIVLIDCIPIKYIYFLHEFIS